MIHRSIRYLICFSLFWSTWIFAQDKNFFSFILLPDTENYSAHWPQIAYSQTDWIAASAESLNIQFVLHLGDITDNCQSNEWNVMHTALHTLDDIVPYSLCVGNHDYDFPPVIDERSTHKFNNYFPYTEAPSTIAGFYQSGIMDNCYHLFQVGYTRYMNLVLEFGPRDEVLQWANQVVAQYPHHKVIISTHCYMNWDDTRVNQNDRFNPYQYAQDVNHGEEMWEKLVKKHENIFMVVSGHMLTAGGLGNLVSENDFGKSVYQMLVDYQGYDNGGNGYLRILKFYPKENRIEATSYSPWLDNYFTDSKNQFVYENAAEAFADLVPPAFTSAPSLTVLEDTPIEIGYNLLATHVDDPNNTTAELTFTLESGDHIQIENSPNGFNGQAPKNWFGTDSLICTVNDPPGLADTTMVIIRILPVNDAPTISDLHHFYFLEDKAQLVDLSFFLFDVDNTNESLQVTATALEFTPGLTTGNTDDIQLNYDQQTQYLHITLAPDVYGTFKTAFQVCDPENLCDADTVNIYISPVNDKPVLAELPSLAFAEDDSLIIYPQNWLSLVTDDSPLAEMQWSCANSQNIYSRQAENKIVLSSRHNWFGEDSLLVIVSDSDGLSDSAFVDVTVNAVNDAPELAQLPDASFMEDENTSIDLKPFISDIDDVTETLNVSARILGFTPANSIQITGMKDLLISIKDFVIGFEATGDSSGNFQVEISLCDPAGACDADTIAVTVIPKNDPPVIAALPPLTWPEDDSLHITRSLYFAYINDPESQPKDLLYSIAAESPFQIVSQPDGWMLHSQPNWFGTDSVQIFVFDPSGAADSTFQRVEITPVNDAPVWQPIPEIHLAEDEQVQVDVSKYLDDVDHDLDELTIDIQVNDSTKIQKTFNSETYKILLLATSESADTLELALTARDPEGLQAETATRIYLSPINDAPIIQQLPVIKLQEDSEISLPLSAWQTYVSDNDHQYSELSWTISGSEHIQVQRSQDILTIKPLPNWFGTDSLLVKISDPLNATDSTRLKITVTPVNDLPTITGLPDSLIIGSTAENLRLWDYIEDVETPDDQLEINIANAPASLFTYYENTTGELILLSTSDEAFERRLKIYVTDAEKAMVQDSIWIRRWPTNIETAGLIEELALFPCYPNPFNGKTSVRYALPASGQVQLYVLNILGKHIADLENGIKETGEHTIVWNADGLPSGAYFIILQTGQERLIQRCLLVN